MNMKKVSLVILMALFCNALHSQNENVETKPQVVVYSFFFNVVPNEFKFPLIGFVNTATGNHQGLQLGFINTTVKNFKGAQAGFINTTLQNTDGLQFGFVNTTQKMSGSQVGFVNTAIKETSGFQLGFVNTTTNKVNGMQLGFVNVATKGIKGSQIGFVNYADTVTGVPIGFISVVKKGGYRAGEISVNEFYPFNLTFKIGVSKLYSFIQAGYNPGFDRYFALGGGFGSLVPMGKRFYFNPEISALNPVGKNTQQQITSFAGNFRYTIWSNLQVALGPSVVWQHSSQGETLYDPIYSIFNHEINNKNRLLIGARAAVSCSF